MYKKVLVTGGAGFIGTNLILFLLKNKCSVVCIDNLNSGMQQNIEMLDNIGKNKFRFIEHDITSKIIIKGIDEIYHLACPASPKHYQKNPIKTINTSILGTFNILEIAEQNNAKVLFSSTSEVYGDPKEFPQKECYNGNVKTIGPRACYDESKRCAETILYEYNKQKKINIKIARIFNTYGSYMSKNDGRVVSNFIINALTNQNIVIYGNGKQTRSFCYIDDTIHGLISLMNKDSEYFGPVNIGNNNEICLLDFAYLVKELTKSSSNIVHSSTVEDDPIRRCPDITKAYNDLRWHPTTTLKSGILQTINYYKDLLNNKSVSRL